MSEDVRKRVVLKEDETLVSKGSRTKGFMGETDINSYEVINSNNEIVGTVEHTHHTAVKGFKVTQCLIQKDKAGNTIVDERW